MDEPRRGQRLILADGMVLENCQAGLADGFLWCWCPGMSMIDATQIFLNPAKTSTIIFEYGEMTDSFYSFTRCVNLMDRNNEMSVCLVRE